MKVATRRLPEEQITVVVVLESDKKDDAMWHVPHMQDFAQIKNPYLILKKLQMIEVYDRNIVLKILFKKMFSQSFLFIHICMDK